ncbi:NHL repeat-containing protein [Rubrobacter aplysinae]|uniref:hypothetical protein n=1 Tax=Rubrobacter aplysinae TaxID=909625 RepID=UPI00064BA6AE|nr:hypothetical protein [Rubrobacter aplysinae]
MRAQSPKVPVLLAVAAFVLVVLALVLTGCSVSDAPGSPFASPFDEAVERGVIRDSEEVSAETEGALVAAESGSVWTMDHGDYECGCGDVASAASAAADAAGPVRLVCSCAAPRYTFVNRIDPESGERTGRLRLEGSDILDLERVGGSPWIVSEAEIAALGQNGEDDAAERSVQIGRLSGGEYVNAADYGGGHVWLAGHRGTVSRLSPGDDTPSPVARLGVGVSDIAVDESAVWVASGRGFEKGRKAINGLTRLDPESGEVVSEVRIEAGKPAGGPGDVAVDEDTGSVWTASNNGKLLQIDPGTNEVMSQKKLGDYARIEAAREGSVWVNVLEPDGKLVRVDGETGEVVGSIRTSVSGAAASGDHLWVMRDDRLFRLTV